MSRQPPDLLDSIRGRATRGECELQVLVPNPAPARWRPTHPERHDNAAEAGRVLAAALPRIFAAATSALMPATSFASFSAVQAIGRRRHAQHAIGDPHAMRAVVGAALFLTVRGAPAVGLGPLVRSIAGGIAVFVFPVFVLRGSPASCRRRWPTPSIPTVPR